MSPSSSYLISLSSHSPLPPSSYQVLCGKVHVLLAQVVRELSNFRASQPYQQALHYASVAIEDPKWSRLELLAVANDTKLVNFSAWRAFVVEKLLCRAAGGGDMEEREKVSLRRCSGQHKVVASLW